MAFRRNDKVYAYYLPSNKVAATITGVVHKDDNRAIVRTNQDYTIPAGTRFIVPLDWLDPRYDPS